MSAFENKRLQFHTASKVAIETKQPLAAAMNVDGHVVTDKAVWTATVDQFPVNTETLKTSTDVVKATKDLVEVFTRNRLEGITLPTAVNGVQTVIIENKGVNEEGEEIVVSTTTFTKTSLHNGYVWTNSDYPAVELYDAVEMSGVLYSDGEESGGKYQSYEIKGEKGLRVMDWVPATAVLDPATNSPVCGYTGIAEAGKINDDGETEWTILQQSSKEGYIWALANGKWEFYFPAGLLGFDPAYTPTSDAMGYDKVRWTGFKYIGETLDKTVKGLQETTMAIKPFGFTLADMTVAEDDVEPFTYSINVPGFVFMILNNVTGISLGDIEYMSDGSSKITFSDLDSDAFGEATAFTAYALTKLDGTKLSILNKTNLTTGSMN